MLERLEDLGEGDTARRAHLLLLEPVREAASAVQVLARRQKHWLVHDFAADPTFELLD